MELEGAEIKNSLINEELSYGFDYITYLDTLTQKYVDNRETYPSYEQLYPQIIGLFNELVSEE